MSESAPFFTVAIPVFNGLAYIRKAIDSVLAQTFDDWELIVIDNQSTDGTWELLQDSYGTHARVKLLRNETNLGMNGNLARCVREARGEWVAILAADDSYVSHALETAHREIGRRQNLVLWLHSELVFGETFVGIRVIHADAITLGARQTAATLYIKGNIFGPLSNFIFKRSGAVSHDLNFAEGTMTVDSRFWIRLLKANPEAGVFYWPDALSHVLTHEASYSSIYWREGHVMADFFDQIQALAGLGWDRPTLLYQMARVIKCWFRFRRQLPPQSRLLPLAVLRTLARRLLSPENSESSPSRP